MNKLKLPIVAAAFLILASCGEQTTKKSENSTGSFKLSLDNFNGIPKEIDGCSCYFSESDEKFNAKEYLFTAGFDSLAFVSVNSKLIKLKLVSSGREPNTFGDHAHIDIYSNDQYKVIIDIKYIKLNGDETWWNNGTITLESPDSQKVIKQFVGECGC